MKYIIANWKANKNLGEVKVWVEKFKSYDLTAFDVKVIICPPNPFLIYLKEAFIDNGKVAIGGQDISVYEPGLHTGEVTANSLNNIIDYVIIGHSERRRDQKETDQILKSKYEMAKKYNITPIFCFENFTDWLPDNPQLIVYEPSSAISTGSGVGSNLPVEEILNIRRQLHYTDDNSFIYGGSVNEQDASQYLKNGRIDGVLVGGASLDPERFYKIISCV